MSLSHDFNTRKAKDHSYQRLKVFPTDLIQRFIDEGKQVQENKGFDQ